MPRKPAPSSSSSIVLPGSRAPQTASAGDALRAGASQYVSLLSTPTATLLGTESSHPEVASVAILGYD